MISNKNIILIYIALLILIYSLLRFIKYKIVSAKKNAHFFNKTNVKQNTNVYLNFNEFGKNFLPVLNNIKELITHCSDEQKQALSIDFLNIILLFHSDKKLSLYDGYGLFLVLGVISETEELLDNENLFNNTENISKITHDYLMSIEANIYHINISPSNFELPSLILFTSENKSKLEKIYHEYAEIIVKADGVVTEEETKTLKFLSKSFFKEQKTENKPLQAKEFSKNELDAIVEELNNLVGMENIKNDIHSLINIINVNKLRTKEGLPEQKLSLHSVFIGPPGTGKTTIARILSNIYHSLELLPENNFVETDRSGLVAGYVGQTAIKTDDIIKKAKNGILFIDEAYTLKRSDSDSDYGQEAIDILLKRMEDYRENLIIIVAGYEKEMNHFINSNPGLKSRFNRYFHFKDYDSTELTEIYKRIADKSGFILKDEALKTLNGLFEKLCIAKDDKFGNARLARNIFEKTFEKHANRTSYIAPITREILTTIEAVDIPVEEFSNN